MTGDVRGVVGLSHVLTFGPGTGILAAGGLAAGGTRAEPVAPYRPSPSSDQDPEPVA
ncbi:hypothetical protein [Streptomyces pseudovenezuelae]|uniref:Uncharacterized protein n=1 Tax=Streptomyces pseudovenezuelae TaxID=67350 RepID=A0ABT6LMZ3_9ACTN|nr:hypothetical protein [Streptomyces pseudovenezuelae]MDH6217686.1 hypothetical protein [Streptomyces pseudovenezuelae]